ncbi:GNAT family N-acetyltransferase [Sabulicella rubraurantiaca]|uniref:GNAT family N-acetyltransferase n=1 Tax=Sabulicella rubraurantiaca TaxID=2811429 RepID=UPI001A95E100|nr:GNAT family N-acetyltransferase [Sabulicella rubraurantiaca]
MAALRALHDASFAGLARAYDARAIVAHAALVAQPDYAEDVLGSDLWVAERDGLLLGSAGWLAQPDGAARIRKVFVHPDAARQGVATALVTAAERRSGRNRFVLRAYLDAVPLYRRLGYVEEAPGTMELPGGVSMPVLLMRKG